MLEKDALEDRVKNLEHFKQASKAVLDKVAAIRSAENVICVGGECSFAVGALAGFSATYKGKLGMLWMDSHGDFNTPESSPSGYIGGMCLAMACGRGPVLGDEIESRRPLLEEGRLIHLGSRALDPPELEMMRASPMGIFTMKKVSLTGTKEVANQVATRLADAADWIACHLDVDVVDSSIISAVNYPTRGGMTIDQVVSLVKALDKTGKLKVLDVAAYNPDLDRDGSSARAVVEIMRKTLGQT